MWKTGRFVSCLRRSHHRGKPTGTSCRSGHRHIGIVLHCIVVTCHNFVIILASYWHHKTKRCLYTGISCWSWPIIVIVISLRQRMSYHDISLSLISLCYNKNHLPGKDCPWHGDRSLPKTCRVWRGPTWNHSKWVFTWFFLQILYLIPCYKIISSDSLDSHHIILCSDSSLDCLAIFFCSDSSFDPTSESDWEPTATSPSYSRVNSSSSPSLSSSSSYLGKPSFKK